MRSQLIAEVAEGRFAPFLSRFIAKRSNCWRQRQKRNFYREVGDRVVDRELSFLRDKGDRDASGMSSRVRDQFGIRRPNRDRGSRMTFVIAAANHCVPMNQLLFRRACTLSSVTVSPPADKSRFPLFFAATL